MFLVISYIVGSEDLYLIYIYIYTIYMLFDCFHPEVRLLFWRPEGEPSDT